MVIDRCYVAIERLIAYTKSVSHKYRYGANNIRR